LIILTYQSFPLLPESQLAAPQIPDVAGREVSASSAKSIVDIVTFAELVRSDHNAESRVDVHLQIDPKAITQPWINYPLYTAARIFREWLCHLVQLPPAENRPLAVAQSLATANVNGPFSTSTQPSQPAERWASTARAHIALAARANFDSIIGMFDVLQKYWGGVRYIRSALMQKAGGVEHIVLADDLDPEEATRLRRPSLDYLPPELAELLAESSDGRLSDGEGVSSSEIVSVKTVC
jgi:hypothetical protein